MSSDRRSSCRARQWSASAGLAAAAIAVIGMGTAQADDGSVPTDIGLLNTAQTDIAEAFALSGHANDGASFFPELVSIQTPLLSSDNSLVSGFGEALFNGPDQNLAQAGEAFLSAAQALSSATPGIGELGALGAYASDGFQVTDAIFGEIPSTFIGKLTDQIFDIGGFDTASAGAATDLAASASTAAASPDDVIAQAITVVNQSNALLDAAPTTDLSAQQADFLSVEQGANETYFLTQIETLQYGVSAGDQSFLAGADEHLVTAAQGVLSADQAFVAADQAGDLSSSGFNSVDLAVIEADFGLGGTELNVLFDGLLASFDPNLGTDAAAGLDPSIFADLLSSIGL